MKKSQCGVVVRGDLSKALKKFKKKVSESGHLNEIRERMEYVKPSVKRRELKLNSIREQQKEDILEKIASGDNTLRFYTKKKKKKKNSPNSKKNDKNNSKI